MTTAEVPTSATPTSATPAPGRRPTALVARALGITQGQSSTMFIALALALVLTLGGLPPVLRQRSDGEAAAFTPAPAAPAPAADPSASDASPDASPAPPASASPDFTSPSGSAAPSFAGSDSPPSSSSPDRSESPSERMAPATGEAEVFATVASSGAPHGIAVAEDGSVYVAAGAEVLTFSEGGSAGRRFTVSGDDVALTGLALDGDGGLFALDATSGRVQRIALSSGRQSTYSTLIDLPACQLVVAAVSGCEPGVTDDTPNARAAAFDRTGNLFVADAAQGAIWRIPAGGGDPSLFTSDAAFGAEEGLAGIAVSGDSILVASPQAIDAEAAAGGAIYRIAIGPEGKAGDRTLVARFLPGERPAGLALLPDGSMAVALQEADAVVLLDPEGAEVRRVEGTAGDTPIDTPTGLAFQGDTLLATNQAADKANWAVLAIGIR